MPIRYSVFGITRHTWFTPDVAIKLAGWSRVCPDGA
jgi:hypothetical protein